METCTTSIENVELKLIINHIEYNESVIMKLNTNKLGANKILMKFHVQIKLETTETSILMHVHVHVHGSTTHTYKTYTCLHTNTHTQREKIMTWVYCGEGSPTMSSTAAG